MTSKATMTDLRALVSMLSAPMDGLGVDRVTISDHMKLVKIPYPAFLAMFGARSDCQRLGSEIRCTEDGITFSSEVVKDHGVKIEGGEEI